MYLFDDAIHCLSQALGLTDLRRSPQTGDAALRIDGVAVHLLECASPPGLILRACLHNIASGDYAQAMEQVLAGNLFEDGPVSSVLSMDPAGDIYLAQHLPSQALGATVFLRTFHRFVERAAQWQRRLGEPEGPNGQVPAAQVLA
jgi:hypothetical protein